jgi:hypothetical protein
METLAPASFLALDGDASVPSSAQLLDLVGGHAIDSSSLALAAAGSLCALALAKDDGATQELVARLSGPPAAAAAAAHSISSGASEAGTCGVA